MPPKMRVFYVGLAASYILGLFFAPYPLHVIHKALPILLLLIGAAISLVGRSKAWILAALFFSASGDMLLASNLAQGFIFGLSAFALAHLCYTFCFYRWRAWHTGQLVVLLPFAGYLLGMLYLLIPASGDLKIPVIAYVGIIACMTISAILVTPPNRFLLLGAACFVLSDSLLALNKFIQPLPLEGVLIMSSYYAAQYFLVNGCILKRISDEVT